MCNIHKGKATSIPPAHPTVTHTTGFAWMFAHNAALADMEEHSSLGCKSTIRPGWAGGCPATQRSAPLGAAAAASAWNFPPVGRPAEPHPIGGARWRRCVGAEVSSASHAQWTPERFCRGRVGGVRGEAGARSPATASVARPGDGEAGGGLPSAQSPSPLLWPDPRPAFPLLGPI